MNATTKEIFINLLAAISAIKLEVDIIFFLTWNIFEKKKI